MFSTFAARRIIPTGQKLRRLARCGAGALGWALLLAAPGRGEEAATGLEGEALAVESQLAATTGEAKKSPSEWVLAPIPSLGPSQGWGLKLLAARIYRDPANQASTPPSIFGVAGLYTQKKSYALGVLYQGYLADDLWRVTAGAGFVRLNSDYYGVGSNQGSLGLSIPIEQRAGFGMGQLMRRVRPNLYLGLRALALQTDVTAHPPSLPPVPLPELTYHAAMYAASPVLQWDTRDNTFYPTQGTLINARVDVYGGEYDFRSTTMTVNHYQTLGGGVLAWRGYLQWIDGSAPFFALCSFGQGSDLRGYTSGKYRDYAMLAGQAEYRWRLSPRWGVVAFAGAGQIAPSLGAMSTEHLLASAGGGVRFRLGKENPLNFRMDFAWGRDGGALYLAVGEAF